MLFSSLKDNAALFPSDTRSRDVAFLQQRIGDATVSGASVKKTIGDKAVWIQTGEDLANRDVLIDDIVADFYRNVGWITLPILLVLLIADIAIFRRALAAAAAGLRDRQRDRTSPHRRAAADRRNPARGAAAGLRRQFGAGPARGRFSDSARFHR